MASKASENVKSVHADNEATSLSCLLAMPEYNKYDPDFINAVSTLLMLKGEHGSISDHETRHSGQRNADCSISDHETNYSGQRDADGAVGYRSLLVSDHETNCYRQRNVDGRVGYSLRSRNYWGQRNTVGQRENGQVGGRCQSQASLLHRSSPLQKKQSLGSLYMVCYYVTLSAFSIFLFFPYPMFHYLGISSGLAIATFTFFWYFLLVELNFETLDRPNKETLELFISALCICYIYLYF